MKIAVLDLSFWPPEYMSGQPRFGNVLAIWTARAVPKAQLTVIDVVEGDPLPDIADYDGYVISGSDKGVYDEAIWMQSLRRFLLDAKAAGKPLFGVCFGHQIMAETFGGKAEKVGAPEVGVRAFSLGGETTTGHVWHQDQVTEVPPGATVIGRADYCPIAALAYDFPALSVQFHPEYPADYVLSFLRRSRGEILSEAMSDEAIAQLEKSNVQADLFVDQAAAFFSKHII